MGFYLLGLQEHWHDSIVLVTCQLMGLFLLDQSKVKVLLGSFLMSPIVLILFDFFIEFFCVDFGDVLHHDCDVLGVELALVVRVFTSNLGL